MIKYLPNTHIDFDQKLVLVSGVSIGNIPTLALDLLIAANGLKRVGFIRSDHLQPSAGYLDGRIEEGALGLPAQIYMKNDTVIIQLRSAILFARKKQFVQQIAKIVGEKAELVLLSSLPYDTRPDCEIGSVDKKIYYHGKLQSSQLLSHLKSNKNFLPISQLIHEDEQQKQVFSEGGIAKQMLQQPNLKNLTALFVFGTEMQDRASALFLAKTVRSTVGMEMNRKQLAQDFDLEMIV